MTAPPVLQAEHLVKEFVVHGGSLLRSASRVQAVNLSPGNG